MPQADGFSVGKHWEGEAPAEPYVNLGATGFASVYFSFALVLRGEGSGSNRSGTDGRLFYEGR